MNLRFAVHPVWLTPGALLVVLWTMSAHPPKGGSPPSAALEAGAPVAPPATAAANPTREAAPPSPATPRAVEDAGDAAPPFDCLARLQAARLELLSSGFGPSTDTAKWLTVDAVGDELLLHIQAVASPDGDGLRVYEAGLTPKKGKPRGWRLGVKKVWDEFHEEHLPERTWTRTLGGFTARVYTRADESAEESAFVAKFERITRKALDACLEHPGPHP